MFKYELPNGAWEKSELYTWGDMTLAVRNLYDKGIGDLRLWDGGNYPIYGMVNIAAFLAQAMQETIKYNACDENNWYVCMYV